MGVPNYTVDGRPVCQHIFCDNRAARGMATWEISRSWGDGTRTELICDDHIRIIEDAWRRADYRVSRIWWASEPDGRCPSCGGRTWVGEPWSPDSCPECMPRVHAAEHEEEE